MQSTPWSKETVIKFLEQNDSFKSFVNGKCDAIHYRINNVNFLIYRNNISVQFYYPAPYDSAIDYSSAESFFYVCGPVLSKIVCDAADKRLTSKE